VVSAKRTAPYICFQPNGRYPVDHQSENSIQFLPTKNRQNTAGLLQDVEIVARPFDFKRW